MKMMSGKKVEESIYNTEQQSPRSVEWHMNALGVGYPLKRSLYIQYT